MNALNISSFIWGIADDVLRDVYVRGKYRDVILPMTVIRRLDAVLEPTNAGRAPHEGAARRGGHHQPGRRPAPGRRRGFLQHVAVPAPRSHRHRPAAALASRLRDLPLRLLAQRRGGPRQVQVPSPDSHAGGSRRAGLPGGEVPGQLDQPQPPSRAERRRLGASAGPGQPRHGHGLRGADPALQRGKQRGGRRALHPARRGAAHGAPGLPAGGRSGRVRHLPGLRRRLRHRRHADGGGGDADAAGRASAARTCRSTSTARR